MQTAAKLNPPRAGAHKWTQNVNTQYNISPLGNTQQGVPINIAERNIHRHMKAPTTGMPEKQPGATPEFLNAPQSQSTPLMSTSSTPPPPPLKTSAPSGLPSLADVEAAVIYAESFFLNHYRDCLLVEGYSMESAQSQATQAIAKLHELEYFVNLRNYYMRDVYACNVSLSAPSHSVTSAPSASSQAAPLSAPFGGSVASAAGRTFNSAPISVPQQPVQQSFTARANNSNLFQLKLHSLCYQTASSDSSRVSLTTALVTNSDSSPAIMSSRQEGITTLTKKRRFDKTPLDLAFPNDRSPVQPATFNCAPGGMAPAQNVEQEHFSSRQDLGQWVQRVYSVHSQGRGIDMKWTKQVSLYIAKIIDDFRSGKTGERNWAAEPIPTAEAIIAAVGESTVLQEPDADKAIVAVKERNLSKVKNGPHQLRCGISMSMKYSADEQNKRVQRMERFGAAADGRNSDNVEYVLERKGKDSPHEQTIVHEYSASACRQDDGAWASSCQNGPHAPVRKFLSWQEKLELAKSTEKFVGLSTALEKPFLRLCGPPDPLTVRPRSVLEQSFRMVLEKWRSDKQWSYCQEQLRSIRQDMTVQGIKNEFALEVYETNGRIALENLDLGQFNQCQAQLPELYRILGVSPVAENRVEFLCYRLLYMALQNMRLDLLRLVGELSDEEKAVPCVQFAMKMRIAIAEGNYNRYFRLAKNAPHKASYLLNMFSGRMIMSSLVAMVQAYRHFSASFVNRELRFENLQDCVKFLDEQKTIWLKPQKLIDCKASYAVYADSSLLKSRKVKALG